MALQKKTIVLVLFGVFGILSALLFLNNEFNDGIQNKIMEKISFKTDDGVTIVGNYWNGGEGAALLLHMMPATKESWNLFAEALHRAGYSVLAIDERGHGASTNGGRIDYKNFTDAEQQKKILDVRAADAWLGKDGKKLKLVAGASIGANLALQYQVENNLPIATVLLSPGFNYRGIETKLLATKLKDPQRVFYAGAKLDGRSSGLTAAQMADELFTLSNISDKKLFISESDKHGTDLFALEPQLMSEILNWLKYLRLRKS